MIEIARDILKKNMKITSEEYRLRQIERFTVTANLISRELDWDLKYPFLEYQIESADDWLKSHEGLWPQYYSSSQGI
jgi:UDP-glucose 4-epimerase